MRSSPGGARSSEQRLYVVADRLCKISPPTCQILRGAKGSKILKEYLRILLLMDLQSQSYEEWLHEMQQLNRSTPPPSPMEVVQPEGWAIIKQLMETFTPSKDFNAEREVFYEKKIRKVSELLFQNDSLGGKTVELKQLIEDQQLANKELKADKYNNLFLYVTINPQPSVTWEAFYKKCQKISTWSCWVGGFYVYEQRGSTANERGKGFHFHGVFKRNVAYKPSKCESRLRTSLKGTVRNPNNEHQLHIRKVPRDFIQDKRDYFTNEKEGEGKEAKQLQDKPWRTEKDIETIYEFGQIT